MPSGKGKTIESANRLLLPGDWEKGEVGQVEHMAFFRVVKLHNTVVVDKRHYLFIRAYRAVQHTVNLSVCKLNKNHLGGQGILRWNV